MPRIVTNPPAPGSREWATMISASKIPAILGISRFKSQFALWHEMAGNIAPQPMDPRRAHWGHVAEPLIAEMWKYDNPAWKLNPLRTLDDGTRTREICYTNDELPFPNLATIDRRGFLPGSHPQDPNRFRIIECKTARTLEDWGREGEEDSIPSDYYAQVIWQMGVSGIHQADIMVLAFGDGPERHEVVWDESLFTMMVARAAEWTESLRADTPPPLDDSKSSYDAVRALHPDIDRDAEIELDPVVALDFLDATFTEKESKKQARLMKSTVSDLMGSARIATCRGVKVADRRRTSGGAVALYPNHKADLAGEDQPS